MKTLHAFVVLVTACVLAHTSSAKHLLNRIKNGNQVHISQARYYTYLTCGNAMCGATILTRNRVITAAHCVNQCTANQAVLVVGLNSLSEISTARKYRVSQIKLHPKYTSSNNIPYDVAILYVSTNIEFTARVGPIQYANFVPQVGSFIQVYGYGVTETGRSSQTLQTTKMEVILNSGNLIYTKAVDTSVLPGDSGGPAVYNGQLVGVTSAVLYNQTIQNTVSNVFVACGRSEIYNFIKSNV